jgi:hypothetical protein
MVANVFNMCITGIGQLYSIGVRQRIQLVYHNFSKTGAGRANLKGVPLQRRYYRLNCLRFVVAPYAHYT